MTRILVVDDDRATTELLQDVFQDEGYVVEVAPNGAVAIESMPQHPPDIVFVDLTMPVMDGVAFLRACRDDPRWSTLRIVLLSARSENTLTGDRFDAFIPKPFDLLELLRTVEATIDRPATNGRARITGRSGNWVTSPDEWGASKRGTVGDVGSKV